MGTVGIQLPTCN